MNQEPRWPIGWPDFMAGAAAWFRVWHTAWKISAVRNMADDGTDPIALCCGMLCNKELRSVAARYPSLSAKWADVDLIMSAQEMLDLLLALAGRKPVYLARAFDPPGWRSFVRRIAARHRAVVATGPGWSASDPFAGAPQWLREVVRDHSTSEEPCLYVTIDLTAARELHQVNNAGGKPTIGQEARLLGYPLCCAEHCHAQTKAAADIMLRAYDRIFEGDEAAIRDAVISGAKFVLTEDEDASMRAATGIDVAPYTSVVMCPACRDTPDSPARCLSWVNEEFVWGLDPALAGMIVNAQTQYDECR